MYVSEEKVAQNKELTEWLPLFSTSPINRMLFALDNTVNVVGTPWVTFRASM